MWDPREDAWLAGFADGEASFNVIYAAAPGNRAGRRPCIFPRMSVGVRADDVGVLRELQRAFGGRLVFDARPQGREDRPASPRYIWHVVAKAALRELVTYFDRFPLRAKKAADYALWREAVLIYVARGGVEPFDELQALRDELMGGRVYRPELAVVEGGGA